MSIVQQWVIHDDCSILLKSVVISMVYVQYRTSLASTRLIGASITDKSNTFHVLEYVDTVEVQKPLCAVYQIDESGIHNGAL